ncbi:flagellar hook assembly protein FlgD [Nitrosophilus alvini]|uniref:flagellar hook assembly protein FlgD n=1 Tax=Nitrosophilus alvini TaxID=2714855 RepID=UPI00190C2B8A|nr:flagellar hook capping FlgD N-terminal domain-containing protein [Nitrosophilus alvini]
MASITDYTTVTGFNGQEIQVVDANYDNSEMNQEDFLKVLLANFQYQDPFEAQDISQFINDTLKLRELEVMNDFESAVQTLTSGSSSTLLLQASNLINEKIIYEGNQTFIQNGTGKVEFKLANNAEIVDLYIYDKNGDVVESETFSNLSGGVIYPFEINNSSLEDGYYSVAVIARNADEDVASTVYSTALVTGIERDEDNIVALYENGSIDLDNITQIGG